MNPISYVNTTSIAIMCFYVLSVSVRQLYNYSSVNKNRHWGCCSGPSVFPSLRQCPVMIPAALLMIAVAGYRPVLLL